MDDPKDLSIETIRKSCKYYISPEKPIGGDAMCRAHSHEHDYYILCWIKSLEDLFHDPDFRAKKEVR